MWVKLNFVFTYWYFNNILQHDAKYELNFVYIKSINIQNTWAPFNIV